MCGLVFIAVLLVMVVEGIRTVLGNMGAVG
jgi:hypothetical protein